MLCWRRDKIDISASYDCSADGECSVRLGLRLNNEDFFNFEPMLFTCIKRYANLFGKCSENIYNKEKRYINNEEETDCNGGKYNVLCCIIRRLWTDRGQAGQYTASNSEAEQQGEAAEEKELTGTIDEIKDFMCTVTDAKDTPYSFTFDEKPEGLDNVSAGDTVTVKYTGTISEVDAFEGKVISVEKAN